MPSSLLPTSSSDLTRLSRRALLLGAPLALAGCTVRGRFNDDEARFDLPPRAAGLGEWEEVYGARFDNGFEIEAVDPDEIDPIWLRRVVAYDGFERPGTIIVDPAAHYLYLVRENGRAIRYGVGVGREGFSWKGRATIARKGVWPTWTPPHEMTLRDEEAAKWAAGMPGGPANPLGARALYLYQGKVDTLYRIHGNNDPTSIGKSVSSGCIRMLNQDIVDLHARVPVGTNVLVLG